MLHGNFGEQVLKSAPPVGRLGALPLILIDDQDAIPGPPQNDRMIGEGILPFPRFPMVEDLLRVRLAHVNDGETLEVPLEDLRRSHRA